MKLVPKTFILAISALLVGVSLVLFPVGADRAFAVDPSMIEFNNDTCELTSAGYIGDGSEVDPYVISDADSLWEIADCSLISADTPAHFSISSDIDVTQAASATTTIPIGSRAGSPIAFKGVLRGNGFLISGISMSHATDGVGLFGFLYDSTIDNLRISGDFAGGTGATDPNGATGALARAANGTVVIDSVTIDGSVSGEYFIGGLIGHIEIGSDIEISSSTNHSLVAASSRIAGGLVGYNPAGSVTITASHNTGSVYSGRTAGGLIGFAEGTAAITTSDNSGSVSTTYGAGGLIGGSVDANITSSHNSGAVRSTADGAGGLVGIGAEAKITSSYNTGLISASSGAGGLIGAALGDADIESSYNNGDVSINGAGVGGLLGAGADAKITSSFNTGLISAGSYAVGGLIGGLNLAAFPGGTGNAEIVSSYNTGQLSGVDDIGGLLGDGAGSIDASFNSGAILGSAESTDIGGLIGDAGATTISDAYNTGGITATGTDIGGLVGEGGSSILIENSYNTGIMSITGDYSGLVGPGYAFTATSVHTDQVASASLDTYYTATPLADMKELTVYSGWDFEAIWGFGACSDNNGLPMLRQLAQVGTYFGRSCGFDVPAFTAFTGDGNIVYNNGVCNLGDSGAHITIDNSFEVSTSDQLWEVTDCVSSTGDIYFKLANDIDASLASFADTSLPIGYRTSGDLPFSGVLSGNAHMISNISMSSTSYGVGLFAYLHSATISNLVISGSFATTTGVVNSRTHSAGALAMYSSGDIDLSFVSNEADVTGVGKVGGLIGWSDGGVNLLSSSNSGAISASKFAGGLVGRVDGVGDLTTSYNTGTVTSADSFAGGLVGFVDNVANIHSSYNTGSVFADDDYAGGLVGDVYKDANITSSYNTGSVSADNDHAGGLVGYVDGGANITSSYNTGIVSAAYDDAGGLVGYVEFDANITSSYNTGSASADDDHAGGLVGYVYEGDADITSSYNTGSVSADDDYSGGLVGYVKYGGANITSSYNTGSVSADDDNAGGLVGYVNESDANITSSYNTGSVSADDDNAGGLVGYVEEDAKITASYNTGPVSGRKRIGGLVGYVDGGANITSSNNAGSVSGEYTLIGGLAGFIDKYANITSSYNTGQVSGDDDVGGLVGYLDDDASIMYSFNAGNVAASMTDIEGRTESAGGFIGNAEGDVAIANSYNSGDISAMLAAGGFLGYAYGVVAVSKSYNTGATTADGIGSDAFIGLADAGASIALDSSYALSPSRYLGQSSLKEMELAESYVGFDFANDWGFGPCSNNDGLPMLRQLEQVGAYFIFSCGFDSAPAPVAPAPYSRPLPTNYSDRTPLIGDEVIISGRRMNLVTSCTIDGVTAVMSNQSADSFTIMIPEGVTSGLKDLVMTGPAGKLTAQGALTVQESIPAIIDEALVSSKVNAGSFNGYVAVYAKGHKDKILSWKIAGKWFKTSVTSDYQVFQRKTIAVGREVKVDLFIDGERLLAKTVLTR